MTVRWQPHNYHSEISSPLSDDAITRLCHLTMIVLLPSPTTLQPLKMPECRRSRRTSSRSKLPTVDRAAMVPAG